MAATSRTHDPADVDLGMNDWILTDSQEQLLDELADASGDFPKSVKYKVHTCPNLYISCWFIQAHCISESR